MVNVEGHSIDGSWRQRGIDQRQANDEDGREEFKGIKDKVGLTKFNGEKSTNDELVEWINKMELYFELNPQNERAKTLFASLHL